MVQALRCIQPRSSWDDRTLSKKDGGVKIFELKSNRRRRLIRFLALSNYNPNLEYISAVNFCLKHTPFLEFLEVRSLEGEGGGYKAGRSSIEQIFRPYLAEHFEGGLPVKDDRTRILSVVDGLKDFTRTDQGDCFIEMEIIGIEPVECASDLHAKGRGIQRLSIGQHDLDAMTQEEGVRS
jgi:hypothetical protein